MKIIEIMLENYFYDLTTKYLIELDIDILTLFLINNLCFEKNIYSHQLISIIMNIIILIFGFYFKIKIIIHNLILYILSSYMYSFYFLLIKYLNTNYFINIYLLGSVGGIISLIVKIIFHVINNNKIIDLDLTPIFILIFSFIVAFFYHFINYKIIFELNPFYFYIFDDISFFIFILMDKVLSIQSIAIIIILISLLIYIEIIELNFCDLNYNTKKKIMERASKNIDVINTSIYSIDLSKINKTNLN